MKHVHSDHVVGESIGPGVKSSAVRTYTFQLGRSTGVSGVPTQGRLILVALAAFQALMLAVANVRHVCNKTQNEVMSVPARIDSAPWTGIPQESEIVP